MTWLLFAAVFLALVVPEAIRQVRLTRETRAEQERLTEEERRRFS